MEWSKYQQDIFSWIDKSVGNLIVVAVAGSGKTTTLVEMVRKMEGSVFLGAFNKKMGEELKSRIAGMEFKNAGTFHSAGFRALSGSMRGTRITVDDKKVAKLFAAWADEADGSMRKYFGFVVKAVSMAKQRGIGIPGSTLIDDTQAWEEMSLYFGIDNDLPEDAKLSTGIECAKYILMESNKLVNTVDFDDMIYLPLYRQVKFWQHDWVLIDEAQDTNPVRRMLAYKLLKRNGRLVAVGDPHQCHPSGTTVEVTGIGKVLIEDLRKGQQVMTYCNGYFPGKVTQGRKIQKVVSRHYEGYLIVISSNGKTHKVTPSHKCLVRLGIKKRGYALYLMERNRQFRVGVCSWQHRGDFGVSIRASQEKADKLWILKFFDDFNEARDMEMLLAYKYRIPQLTFISSSKRQVIGGLLQFRLNRFWRKFGNNETEAIHILNKFGRDYEYPFWTKSSNDHIGSMYSFITQACNLQDGWFSICTYTGDPHKPVWGVVNITKEIYKGKVFSLQVEPTESGRRLYIANDIVTHNSIYGFAGADNNALDLIKDKFNCETLPLTISYRCPKAVVAHAQKWVSHIEAAETAPEGEVKEITSETLLEQGLNRSDAILCRYNKYLVALCFKLIRNGIPARIEGREIGEGLIKLTRKWKVSSLSALYGRLMNYKDREVKKALDKKQESRADRITDQVDTLYVLIERAEEQRLDVRGLEDMIREMFENDVKSKGILTLSSCHRAKGLEWDRVFILGRSELMPSPMAHQEWQQEQELNLIYVAITRAKKVLIEVTGVSLNGKRKEAV